MPQSGDSFEMELEPLWRRAQAGDEEAYRAALACLARRLRAVLRNRMQSLPDDVEDLVQETLLAIHVQRSSWDPAVPVGRWALAIARYKLIDLWRRRGRREALQDSLDDLDDPEQPAVEPDGQARRDLRVLLAELPEAQRLAIELTRIEGLSMAEASRRTGVSETALKVQVHRGMKRLASNVRDDL